MTTWSGMYDGQQSTGYNMLVNTDNNIHTVRMAAAHLGFKKYDGLFNALIGATSGGTASASYSRAAAQTGDVGNLAPSCGGKRVVESRSVINRATTAADVVALKSYVHNVRFGPSTYPTNKAHSMDRWF